MIDIIALQQLAFEISARIVRSDSASLDQDIVESLARLIPLAKADRGGLLTVREDTSEAQVAFNWFASGVEYVPGEGNRAEMFPWCYTQLVKHQRILAIRSLDDLPPEAQVDRTSHEFIGNKSFLLIPLPLGSRVHHLLALNTVSEERAWPEEVVRLLQMLGETFVSALQTGQTLMAATDAASCIDPEFDLSHALALLLRWQLITQIISGEPYHEHKH